MADMSKQAQECLRMLSCLGKDINHEIINYLGFGSEDAAFHEIIQKGWLVEEHTLLSWNFSHNTIREVIYRSIPNAEVEGYHYRLGRKLWRELDVVQLLSYIFVVIEQLVRAKNLMLDPIERTAVAKVLPENRP